MKPNSINVITIDGTSGSGKTTISRLLAKQLRYSLLDSGKLYRSAGYILSKNNQSLTNPSNISQLISCIELKTNPNTFEYEIYYKKNKIDHLLYDEIAGRNASIVSKIPRVRECMLKIQHSCLQGPGLIANGRDMGTEVFPDAVLKLYINASIEIRAKRRYNELIEKGQSINFEDVLNSLSDRDESDINRTISPLKIPDNAEIIDTSELKPDAIVDKILNLYTITEN